MNTQTHSIMGAQWGLITRPQALAAGMTPRDVDLALRRGAWTAVHRGVYGAARFVAALNPSEYRLLADRAASLRISMPHVLSHHSAALAMGLDVLRAPTPITHVTRPGVVGSHLRHGVKHHLAPYAEEQVRTIDGVHLLEPARTALDITRELGFQHGLVAADSAYRLGATRRDFDQAVAAMRSWPQVTVVREVIASASTDADTAGETLMRDAVTRLGFGVPEAQFGLTADGRTVWCDLRLGRHIFEFDGRVKYRHLDQGGFSTDPVETLWEEKGRQDFVTGFKMGMSRVVWDDVLGPGVEAAMDRWHREYVDTCRRFGTDISDLTSYRPRGPRPRPQRRPSVGLPRWVA